MWDSVDDGGGGDTDVFGSGDYGETDYDDNGTSSVQFSFTNVENNRSEENVIELPENVATTTLILTSIVLAVGLLGNILVIAVILTNKFLRSSTNLFLLNLSVADLLVLVTSCPTSLMEIAMRTDAWIFGEAMCYFIPYIELAVTHTSVLTILAITVERYYAICLPLQASIVWTKTKACLTCLVSWLFAFGLTAPIISITTFTPGPPVPACLTSVDNWWSKFYFVVIITVFFFIPLLILVVLYVYIASRLVPSRQQRAMGGPATFHHPHHHLSATAAAAAHHHHNHHHHHVDHEDRSAEQDGIERCPDPQQVSSSSTTAESPAVIRSRRQVVVMLIAVIFFFFACLLPFKVLTLWLVVSPVEVVPDVISSETYFNLLCFCRLMYYINSAINPILYNIMSSKFRDGFKRLALRMCCLSKKPVMRGQSTSSRMYYSGSSMLHTTTTTTTAAAANASWFSTDSPSVAARRSFVVKGRNRDSTRLAGSGRGNGGGAVRVRSRRSLENGSVPFADANAFSVVVERARRQQSQQNGKGATRARATDDDQHSETTSGGTGAKIVFIEERKILLIPTTATAAAPSKATTAPAARRAAESAAAAAAMATAAEAVEAAEAAHNNLAKGEKNESDAASGHAQL